jgi:antitoxin VapB
MQTAMLFYNGNSQAVRLPKNFRFQGNEVGIKKIGDSALLYPKEQAWEIFLEGLNNFTDDFFADGRKQLPGQERESI